MKKQINKIAVLAVSVLLVSSSGFSQSKKDVTVNGAGASFPYPLYSKWSYKYNKLTGMKLNYQSIGSGGGIAQIKAKTVNFGASDAPMKPADLDKYGLIQFPMCIGGVVPVINVGGLKSGDIKLSPDTLTSILLGKITYWDDAKIKAENPGVSIPNVEITIIHRSDGSGTTWIFTNYLSKISSEWKNKVGVGKSVAWPTGIGAKGNEGIANYVQRVNGGIGYVEYAYALQNKLTYVKLRNKDGNYVSPENKAFQAAAANADWANAPGYYLVLTDQPGAGSWPITGASFILIYKEQTDTKIVKSMLEYFDWCYRHGSDIATELHYIPIPENVVDMVEKVWSKELKADGQPLW